MLSPEADSGLILRYAIGVRGPYCPHTYRNYSKSAVLNQVVSVLESVRERMGSFLIPVVNDAERQTIGQENNRHGLSPLLHR